jgi:hypothetical protein
MTVLLYNQNGMYIFIVQLMAIAWLKNLYADRSYP